MMNKKPLISVVLPVYNCAPYIEECLSSICNQTIQDFEIIIIDDCSTDNTVEVIQAINEPRIKLHTKQVNKGLIDSLNTGFSLASGTYIARVDGDDINALDRFEKQLAVLINNPKIKACGCWLQCFGVSDKIIRHAKVHSDIQARLLLGNSMSLGATMLERETFKGVKFNLDKKHAEDYDFWARTAWDAQFYNIQESLYFYRIHEQQVSTQHKEIQLTVDVAIKLPLFKKLKYDEAIFTDALIKQVLYTEDKLVLDDVVKLQTWFLQLKINNRKLEVYDVSALEKVLKEIERQLLNQIYYTNNRQGVDYDFRRKLLKYLPFLYKKELVLAKIKERLKVSVKRIKKS